MIEAPETFFTLLRNTAHWEFELFVTFVFDVLVVGLVWPFIRKHVVHHLECDRKACKQFFVVAVARFCLTLVLMCATLVRMEANTL